MNVLVAMDGSKHGRWALNWVTALPLAEAPKVTALHVVDIGALRAPFVVQPVIAGNERFVQQEIRRIERRAAETLGGARRQMTALQLKGTVKKEQGAVAPVILREAPKNRGLIIVGSQGLDAFDRFMLGSVSTNILHHASCPVLIVKGEAQPPRRIVLAVDGSTSSKKALDFVSTKFLPMWPERRGGEKAIHVIVVHVMPFLNYPELKEAGSRLVEAYTQTLARAGFSTQALCRLGKPAEHIMKTASQDKAHLIVMGAKGLGAVARFFLGSVSTRVAQRATQTVLVVR